MTATPAPVNHRPFSVVPDPNANRVHYSTAIRLPVARLIIEMKTRKTIRAVIPVPFTVKRRINFPAADFARKTFLAWMSPVIILVKTPAFVLSVQF